MSRGQPVTRSLRQRVSVFLADAYPGQQGRAAEDPGFDFGPHVPEVEEASKHLDYIRQLRSSKKLDCSPTPDRAWEVGAALSRLSGKRWLNPVVMLFACGHYAEVAALFVGVSGLSIRRPILAEMARALPRVVLPGTSDEIGIGDQLAFQESKRWDQQFQQSDSFERRVWSLDAATFSRFVEIWRARNDPPPEAFALINACTLIAKKAEYEVAHRDQNVSFLISGWLEA